MSDLERMISKETNIHKKAELEQILSCFRKCINEVRYRTIDSKLKEKKIGQLMDRFEGGQVVEKDIKEIEGAKVQ